MDPITDQDLPIEELIENSDGSVDIEELESTIEVDDSNFQVNLAELLSQEELDELALTLLEQVDRDAQDRKKRDQQYEEGLRRTGLGDEAPGGAEFEGASKVVHPALAEACVDFEARAIKEIFPPQGPVKTSTIGQMTDDQLERAERKRTFMNWQLTVQMKEYRSEVEQLLTQLPLGGSQFQKFRYDERLKRPVCEFVPIDDILIPYSAASFYTSPRVTHVQKLSIQEYDQRVSDGLYRKVDGLADPTGTTEETLSAEANESIEGKEDSGESSRDLRELFEIYVTLQITDSRVPKGEYAPYIVSIEFSSKQVVGIYRNWEEQDSSLEKLDWIVEWKFIPWRGAYGIGFPQLIGSLSAAATGALRALLDSAHINNLPGVVKMKGGNLSGQQVEVSATGVTEVEGAPGIDDIRKLMMPMPFGQPSAVLFQLLGWLTDAAKNVVRTTENAIQNVGDRTPVGTTQAMIEQGSAIYSAIHARLHESQFKALQILSRINRTWLDEETQIEELGKLIIRREDFIGSMDVLPVSDPAIFSEAQRYAQNQSLLQMQAQDAGNPNIPWNGIAIRRRMLKQLRIDNVDEILPLPSKPVSADPLTEVSVLLKGQAILAIPNQNHLAHIQAHLVFLGNPLTLQNPLVPGQPLMMLLQHIQTHIDMYMQQQIAMGAQKVAMQGVDIDMAVAYATGQVMPSLMQKLAPVVQKLTQLQEAISKKIPPPPLPPEIQSALKIAEMETQRKTQMDQATIQLKGQQQEIDKSMSLMKLQMDKMQQLFDQFIDQRTLELEDQIAALNASVELQKNTEDNQQKQETELLKNRDDNVTQESIANHQIVSDHKVAKLQSLLDQLGKPRQEEAMNSVLQGIQTVLETINKPRKTQLIFDDQGRPIGATSSLE